MQHRNQHIITTLLWLYFACLILILPLRWLLGWLMALLIHELGHWLAVVFCGGSVMSFRFMLGGFDMVVSPMSQRARFACILCGPLIGMLPVVCYRIFPVCAVFSMILTLYNLIPIRPLDGGRLLELILDHYTIKYDCVECMILWFLFVIAAALGLFYNMGILPIAIVIELAVKNRKITCKRGVDAVQ